MTDKTNILKTIKILLGMSEDLPVSPAYTLADGTPIEVSALEVGGTVVVGDMPAPAGEHELSDGTKITTDIAGIITDIKAPEIMSTDPAAPAQEGEAVPTAATIENMVDEAVKKAVDEAVGQAMGKYATKMQAQEKGLKTAVQLLEEILKTPTVDSPAPNQTFKKQTPISKSEKFAKLAETMKQIKNN